MVFIIDWTNPPQSNKITSLWELLHDAGIKNISSDAVERTLTIQIENKYIFRDENPKCSVLFEFIFTNIESLRIYKYAAWPGEWSIPPGTSREEAIKLNEGFRQKGREESLSWIAFEKDSHELEVSISSAELIQDTNHVAMKLVVDIDSEYFGCVCIRASTMSIVDSNAHSLSLEYLVEKGIKYWSQNL